MLHQVYVNSVYDVVIDSFATQSDGSRVFGGWAVDKLRRRAISIDAGTSDQSVAISRFPVSSIAERFDISDNQKVGFETKVPAGKPACDFVLHFPAGKQTVRVAVAAVEQTFRHQGWAGFIRRGHSALGLVLSRSGRNRLAAAVRRRLPSSDSEANAYQNWVGENEQYDKVRVEAEIESFAYQPLISIVVPVYNVEEQWLRKCIDSVLGQWYANLQLCLADDNSPSPHVRRVLDEYAARDTRISVVYRHGNGGISAATNSALEAAQGEYIGFLDNDDELAPFALYEVVKRINEVPGTDFLYSDEDKINAAGARFDPFFKPGFSPYLLLSHNYITHFVVVSSALYRRAGGGLRSEFNGSQDYDFVLRATEAARHVEHIAIMLYHWRTLPSSVAGDPRSKMYAYEAGQHALEAALTRRGLAGFTVSMSENLGTYRISYDRRKNTEEGGVLPSVRVITSDYTSATLALLKQKTDYDQVEFIARSDFERQEGPISGEPLGSDYLVFLDGVVPLHPDWLEQMVSAAGDPSIGVVSGKILARDARNLNVGISLAALKAHAPFTARGSWDQGIGYYFRTIISRDLFAANDECLLISSADYSRLGGFDRSLPKSLQGVDLSIRLRRQLSRAVLFFPFSIFSDWKRQPFEIAASDIEAYLLKNSPLEDPYAVRLFPPDDFAAAPKESPFAGQSSPIASEIGKAVFDSETGRLFLSGWAADCLARSSTKIEMAQLGQGPSLGLVPGMKVTSSARSDVNMRLGIPTQQQLGFEIEATVTSAENLALIFVGAAHATVVDVDVVMAGAGTDNNDGGLGKRLQRVCGIAARMMHPSSFMKQVMRGRRTQLRQWWAYRKLIARTESYDRKIVDKTIESFGYRPLISVIMPVYNVDEKWLRRCIKSVQKQWYSNWELCIADDCSPDERVREVLRSVEATDSRIKVIYRSENGNISRATNSALNIAQGEFVALLDDDDELSPFALYEVVLRLNQSLVKGQELDLIYSDEDKITERGRRWDPAFKPDFSPDLLLSTNYISHLGIYRTSIAKQIGGFRVGFEGAQDYDFVLRFIEQSDGSRVAHIAKVLYHWRTLPTSTASDTNIKRYAVLAGLKSLQETFERQRITAGVEETAVSGIYHVEYGMKDTENDGGEPLVSIIIPTKDGYDNIDRVLNSILADGKPWTGVRIGTQNGGSASSRGQLSYEILIADNGSRNPRMTNLYQKYQQEFATEGRSLRVLHIDIPFNYSRINNVAARQARGRYLLFLNDDTQVINEEWMRQMVGLCQFDRVGVVGAQLSYPTNTIQHAGIVLGMGGVAGHIMAGFPNTSYGYFGRLLENANYYAVTAACCMIKASDFWAVDGFDESFDIAYNDVDLCIRVHDRLGKDNVVASRAKLLHFESQTRGLDTEDPEKKARLDHESARFYQKYSAIVDNDPYYNPNLSRISGNFWIREE